ncbi:MAG: outer membrane channel protein TolC [Thalassotalea sp.]
MKKTLRYVIAAIVTTTASHNAWADDLLSNYQQALKNDPVTLKAKAQFMATKESIEQARAVLLPQINAYGSIAQSESESYDSSSLSNNISSSELERTSLGANLSMQIYHHNSWLKLDNAKKSAHRGDIAYQLAKQDLIVRVTQAYFNVLSAQDDLEFSQAEKTAIERQLEQTKQRFSVGLTAITDVHEAQAEYDNAVTSEIRAQNKLYSAEEGLRELTNVYPHDINILNTTRFSASRPLPDSANEWQQTAEAKSLELIFQKIGLDIAKENINIAKSGHYPTVSLSGNYSTKDDTLGGDSFTSGDFNAPGVNSHSIGIEVNVPIYSGGATSSAVRQAQHSYVAASQDLVASHRTVVRTTRNAYNTVIANVSGIKSLEQAVLSAQSALQATEAGFEVGTRTIVDVLNSTRNLYNAKRNLSSTRYGYIQSILSLKRAAGIISEKDIEDINAGLTAK